MAVEEIHAATREQKRLFDNERRMRAFDEFMKKESYHDIRFPELNPNPESLGLEYTIAPVRDPNTGEPCKHELEMDSLYVVKVLEPVQWRFLKPERRKEYEGSPIEVGRQYFCAFYNDSWHLGDSDIHQPYRFYLSGKVGPAFWGTTADEFVAALTHRE
jgi:hypothetical protein